MRNRFAIILPALVCLGLASAPALAGTMSLRDFVGLLNPSTQTSTVQVRLAWDPKPNGSGQQFTYSDPRAGEFIVEVKNGTAWDRIAYDADGNGSLESIYKTFCVEMGEHIDPVNQPGDASFWTAYATLDENALFGKNVSPSPLGDPLSVETEVLYGLYHQGLLGTLVPGFAYQNKDWAAGVQQAVWVLEDNLTFAGVSPQAQAILNALNGNLNGYSFPNVMVLNLWNSPTGRAEANAYQSQLIAVPAPEPATFAIWSGLALLGMGIARRRRA